MPGDGFWRPGSDFGTPRLTFSPGDVFGVILGSRKDSFAEEFFCGGEVGDPSCPNEFHGPWEPYGQATLSQNLSKK
jgi:hypothetical protein